MSKKKKISFSSFLKAKKLLQKDEDLQDRFDANQDGTLDADEMEEGAKVLGAEIEATARQDPARRPHAGQQKSSPKSP